MAKSNYPALEFGSEWGVKPSKLRASGRDVTVLGAILDNGKITFDNGSLHGRSQVEKDIQFGPEVLRAMKGRRVMALFLAAVKNDAGEDGWYGLTAGEMRIDTPGRDGFKDANAFTTKLTEAAQGRVSVYAFKEPDRPVLEAFLREHPELWRHADRGFRDTILTAIPSLASLDVAAAEAAGVEVPVVTGPRRLGEGTFEPQTLRMSGRDVTMYGIVVDGSRAEWDNGLLVRQAKVEKGITFGPEPLRALGGRRVCGVWIAVTADEEGDPPGYYGATVGLMRIDELKNDGFKDLNAHGMKLNDAARGRVELARLQPEERKAVGDLLRGHPELYEHATENIRNSLE